MSFFLRKILTILVFIISLFLLAQPELLFGVEGLYLALSLFLVLSALIFIIPKPLDGIFTGLSVVLMTLYVGMQTVYFRAFNQYGSIQLLYSYRTEVVGFQSSIQDLLILEDIKYALIPLIALIIIITVSLKSKKAKFIKDHMINITLAGIVFSLALLPYGQFQKVQANSTDESQSISLYDSVSNLNQFVSQYGLVAWAYREISSLTYDPIVVIENEITIQDQITEILLSKPSTTSNAYSGLFIDKDLLLIEAESLVNLVIDPILTPTLYKLKTEGIFVEGYNSPLLTGSTSDTEFMANTSLLPSFNGKIAFNDYAENTYPQTLAKVFTSHGYTSIAAHNNYGEYYNRAVMLPNLGYEFFDAIGLEAYDNVEDSYVIDHLKWMTYEHDKSFAFWITFNAHQPYDLESLNPKFLDYYKIVEETYPLLSTEEMVYMAKTMDFDRGLKQLLIDYKNSNVLDDLVIIIYGDHYPKGIFSDPNTYQNLCDQQVQSSNCLNTPLIIYNTSLEGDVHWKISNPLDIAPTIYDLFGLKVDDKLNLGYSVFDPNYKGFLFDAWNVIKTDNFIYDPLQNSLNHDYQKDEDSYWLEAKEKFYQFSILKNIVTTNYFAK